MKPAQQEELLQAILRHVPFDGWSPTAFAAACADLGIDAREGLRICPRGATELAALHHRLGDRALIEALAAGDLGNLRYSQKVARAIRMRIDLAGDKEVVRRATAMFALPVHAVEGATLLWGTADAIWAGLGDTSRDGNWYSKRAILSGVYGAAVLYWLGDDDAGEATDAFIDRRIGDVMRFEKFKADARASKSLKPLTGIIDRITGGMRAPDPGVSRDLPGHLTRQDSP